MGTSKEVCIKAHKRLHDALDELVACYIQSKTYVEKGGLQASSIMDLMKWSHEQTKNPECFTLDHSKDATKTG